MRSREGYFGVYFERHSNDGNNHQNNTRGSAQTACHESTPIILFLLRHNKSINDDKNDDLHTSNPWLTRSVNILSDDITVDCWLRHKGHTIVARSYQ